MDVGVHHAHRDFPGGWHSGAGFHQRHGPASSTAFSPSTNGSGTKRLFSCGTTVTPRRAAFKGAASGGACRDGKARWRARRPGACRPGRSPERATARPAAGRAAGPMPSPAGRWPPGPVPPRRAARRRRPRRRPAPRGTPGGPGALLVPPGHAEGDHPAEALEDLDLGAELAACLVKQPYDRVEGLRGRRPRAEDLAEGVREPVGKRAEHLRDQRVLGLHVAVQVARGDARRVRDVAHGGGLEAAQRELAARRGEDPGGPLLAAPGGLRLPPRPCLINHAKGRGPAAGLAAFRPSVAPARPSKMIVAMQSATSPVVPPTPCHSQPAAPACTLARCSTRRRSSGSTPGRRRPCADTALISVRQRRSRLAGPTRAAAVRAGPPGGWHVVHGDLQRRPVPERHLGDLAGEQPQRRHRVRLDGGEVPCGPDKVLMVVRHELEGDCLLGLEVVVDAALEDARRRRDLAHRGARVPVGREEVRGRPQDLVTATRRATLWQLGCHAWRLGHILIIGAARASWYRQTLLAVIDLQALAPPRTRGQNRPDS